MGGIIDDPRGLVFANPRGTDPLITLHSGLEDYVIEPGMSIMFDCHGTWNMYCWDGGKTWIVDAEPIGQAAEAAKATKVAVRELENAMRPGVKVSELQAKTRRVFKDFDIRPDSVYIFFHGLGLSHSDLEESVEEGKPYPDWSLEEGMVVATHLFYPGGGPRQVLGRGRGDCEGGRRGVAVHLGFRPHNRSGQLTQPGVAARLKMLTPWTPPLCPIHLPRRATAIERGNPKLSNGSARCARSKALLVAVALFRLLQLARSRREPQ